MMTKMTFSVLAALSITFAMGCGGSAPPAAAPTDTSAATSSAAPAAPGKDTDGDGIPDATDKCPDKKEDGQAPDPKDGCPKA
jgi:hypothetical protein